MKIAVCWKWVSLDREREADRRWSGVSAADEAALEVALDIADQPGTHEVTVICLGPPSADDVLRDAIAVGADSVVRVDASTDLDSHVVAAAVVVLIDAMYLQIAFGLVEYDPDRLASAVISIFRDGYTSSSGKGGER